MKADVRSIGSVLSRDKKYFIPPYQRPYQWDKDDDAEQLARDLHESYLANKQEYFIGSIICIAKSGNPDEVVDGQQRLITLSLIFLAMSRIYKDKTGDVLHSLRELVWKIDDLKPEKNSPRMQVRSPEDDFYRRYILDGEDVKNAGNVTTPQKVFLNNLNKIKEFLADTLVNEEYIRDFAVYVRDKVSVVFVEVEDRLSSFRLFNVLNNRGTPLSQADLLKNELLASAYEKSEQLYRQAEKDWLEMENLVGQENLNGFLTIHQISEKKDRDRVKKKNYEYYNDALHSAARFRGDSSEMMCMLRNSAEHYSAMLDGDYGAPKTVGFLVSLSRQEEWAPAFIAFLNKIGREKFPQFAELFEKVYMHSFLSGDSKSGREAACYYVVEAINNQNASYDDIMSVLQERADNARLEQALESAEFYDPSRPLIINLVKSILFRVEQELHDDSASKILPDWKKVTVEHILPQELKDKYWTVRFTEEQHGEWLHKLGNLTLLARGKNAAGKHYGFDKKKEAYVKSNKQSPFQITKELCDLPEWTLDTLKERHKQLKAKIMDLWKVEERLL